MQKYFTAIFPVYGLSMAKNNMFEFHGMKLVSDPEFILNFIIDKPRFKDFFGLRLVEMIKKGIPCLAATNIPYENTDEFRRLISNIRGQIDLTLSLFWLVKDNAIFINDGLIELSEQPIKSNRYYRRPFGYYHSLEMKEISDSFTYRKNTHVVIELIHEINKFKLTDVAAMANTQSIDDNIGYDQKSRIKVVPPKEFNSMNRVQRACFLIRAAQKIHEIQIKISFYMAALESLFSTSPDSVKHKVSERVAYYLGNNKFERIEYYNKISLIYSTRSKFVHGDKPPSKLKEWDAITEQSRYLDSILRQVIRTIILSESTKFEGNDEKIMNDYFLDLQFS